MTDLTNLATDWGEWLLLHRAGQGAVRVRDGGYLLDQQPVAGYLAAVLDALLESDLLAVDSPDPGGAQRLRVTATGQARYTALSYSRPNGTGTVNPGPPAPPARPGPS